MEMRARAGISEPPSSFLEEVPQPRKSTPKQSASVRSTLTNESAVASSGAFDPRASSHRERAAAPVAPSERAIRPESNGRMTLSRDGSPDSTARFESQNRSEELMEQARSYVCRSCSTPVPLGHKFCGRCGAALPPEILAARTQFFGQLQTPGRAKLTLIRGEGVEGLSYQLNAEQHILGRRGQIAFDDDPFISPRHANVFYRNGKLVVKDEGSTNGTFVRVRGRVEIASGQEFLAGEQLFRVTLSGTDDDGPAPDGTVFYSSPKQPTSFRLIQVLQGGTPGMVVCARTPQLQVGREGSDLNFPGDMYMSASHCRIEETAGKLFLTDLNSRNGTYVRLHETRELNHGDYLFLGRKLLRVEITGT
jgi:pSer/pThr/pTyr-binding forkhead associated (FHA) protein